MQPVEVAWFRWAGSAAGIYVRTVLWFLLLVAELTPRSLDFSFPMV